MGLYLPRVAYFKGRAWEIWWRSVARRRGGIKTATSAHICWSVDWFPVLPPRCPPVRIDAPGCTTLSVDTALAQAPEWPLPQPGLALVSPAIPPSTIWPSAAWLGCPRLKFLTLHWRRKVHFLKSYNFTFTIYFIYFIDPSREIVSLQQQISHLKDTQTDQWHIENTKYLSKTQKTWPECLKTLKCTNKTTNKKKNNNNGLLMCNTRKILEGILGIFILRRYPSVYWVGRLYFCF